MSQKKIAIVTGGNGGYGAGIAEAFKKDGAEVWITGRNREKLESTANRLGVHMIQADVTKLEDWDLVFETVLSEAGTVDYLINNAGGGVNKGHLVDLSDEDIIACIGSNLLGVILGSKRAAKIMKEKGTGTIVNISSVVALEAWPGWSVYSAAKGGLDQFTKCLYAELRPFGAKASLVIPSWGQTDFMVNANLPAQDDEIRTRATKPLELGELVLYVCKLPAHLWIQEVILWPTVQEVIPL
jgi:NAD(P)-dependent dehydrogenase (short-subunit alcohol dehydrogenase family)